MAGFKRPYPARHVNDTLGRGVFYDAGLFEIWKSLNGYYLKAV
jgi:hypothetical protein